MFIRKIGMVTRTYRHIGRYRQILAVLFKYGFGDLVDRLDVGRYLELGSRVFGKGGAEPVEARSRHERIRMAFEELGPTFIKMGQILSTRPDLIPVALAEELSSLQDSVPPFPFQQARELIEAELDAGISDVFQSIEETPLAAASIAQVHRARLSSGRDVVVKVQRPGIERTVTVDLEILLHLAGLAERHVPELSFYRPTRIVEEFARVIERELDYSVEARFMERFARQFAGNDSIHVPAFFSEYSTNRILTMEYIEGIKASNIEQLDADGYDRKLIASRGAELVLDQVFRFGLFHADPHPGNVFILPGNVICYVDFGMMGTVDQRTREDFVDILTGYVGRDEVRTAQAVLKVVEWEKEPDRRALEKDLLEFMEMHLYRPLKEIRVGDVLQEFMGLVSKHRLLIPADLYLMIKTLTEMEGLGLRLDPDFDMVEKTAPYIKQIKMQQFSPGRIASEILNSGSDLVQLARAIPGELREILSQLKLGRIRIGLEHRGIEEFIEELDRSSNRISFALIISSLIIGSSLIMSAGIGPYLFGLPFLGLLGFSIAGVFGIWLVIAIFRSGKL
jgi:ubiquinone biosynthesis protein